MIKEIQLTCEQANKLERTFSLEIEIDGQKHILHTCDDFEPKITDYGRWVHYQQFIVKDETTNEYYLSDTDKAVGNTECQYDDPFLSDIVLKHVKRVKKMVEVEDWEYD